MHNLRSLGEEDRTQQRRSRADVQTKKGELLNNLVAGTIGGFVGTSLNTPCTLWIYSSSSLYTLTSFYLLNQLLPAIGSPYIRFLSSSRLLPSSASYPLRLSPSRLLYHPTSSRLG